MKKFIALEGLDGVGKSTLARGLARQIDGVYMSTPGSVFSDCRAYIMDVMEDDQLGKALFYASTVSRQGRTASAHLEAGRPVIMDRYWPSTVAYAKARGVDICLEALNPGFVSPDLVLLITLDESERRNRLMNRGATAEDVETLCESFTQTVLTELESRCDLRLDLTGMNQSASIEHLEQAIRGYFKNAE